MANLDSMQAKVVLKDCLFSENRAEQNEKENNLKKYLKLSEEVYEMMDNLCDHRNLRGRKRKKTTKKMQKVMGSLELGDVEDTEEHEKKKWDSHKDVGTCIQGPEVYTDEEFGDVQDNQDSGGQQRNLNGEDNDQSVMPEIDKGVGDPTEQGNEGELVDVGEPSVHQEHIVDTGKHEHQNNKPVGKENENTDPSAQVEQDMAVDPMRPVVVLSKEYQSKESLHAKEPHNDYDSDKQVLTFKSLPHQYRPPHGFKSLAELVPNRKLENVVGVVAHFAPVFPTKGSDLMMKIYIKDPSCYETSREILFFRPNKWNFPEIYNIGDIVLFHCLKAGQYQGILQLLSNRATSFLVFPGMSTEDVTLDNARYPSGNPSLPVDTIRAICELRKWLQLNREVIKPTSLVTLSQIHSNSYCHVVANVVRAECCQKLDHTLLLTIYDGTKPPTNSGRPLEGAQMLWDITDKLAKEMLVHVYIGDKHGNALNRLCMTAGQVVLLHAAWVECDNSGCLSLILSNEAEGEDVCGVSFINPNSVLGRLHTL